MPSLVVLQKVRRMRAGMKPPPPMAMKRVGAEVSADGRGGGWPGGRRRGVGDWGRKWDE